MTAQNGVGAEDEAAAARASAILAASLTTAVELGATGVTRRRTGGIGLAPVRGDTVALLHELADAFADGGLPTMLCPDAAAMKWSKLLANLVGNATARCSTWTRGRSGPTQRASTSSGGSCARPWT